MGLFDASALKIKEISNEEFRSELTSKLQFILDKEFPSQLNKRTIKNSKDSINFACPYCGDSVSDSTKKRAHLILRGKFMNLFKCFNCGKCTSITKFFSDFNQDLPLTSIDYINNHQADLAQSTITASENISLILEKEVYTELGFTKEYLKQVWNLYELNDYRSNKALQYLRNRMIYHYDKFLYSPQADSLLILNMVDDKVIGIQFRDLSGKKKAKYITFGLKKLHEHLKTGKEISDELNSMSMLFNLFQVDIKKPVIVIEGPIDSMFIKNSIASCGAFKNISLDIDFWYFYDSDEAGNKESIEKLEKGLYVFMWKLLKDDLRLPKRKKWDINDVMVFCHQNHLNYPVWQKYFSNDSLDILDI